MAGPQRSSSLAKQKSHGGKNINKEPTRQFSLIDTEVGTGSGPAVGGGVVGKGGGERKGEREVGKDDEATVKMETTGTLLDLGEEDTAPDMNKGKEKEAEKSAFEQLLELEGIEMGTVTATTTTTITTTTTTTTTVAKPTKAAETKAHSPTASAKSSTTSSKSQLLTDGSLFIRELSLWGTRSGDSEQATQSATNISNDDLPIATAETSDDHDDGSNIDISTLSGPSSSPQGSSTEFNLATTTLAAQELAKETGAPFNTLGSELDLWAAQLASSNAGPARYSRETESEKDGGYIRRFHRRPTEKEKGRGRVKGKESEAMPDESNAMVKYDPFQSLWLNAAKRFDGGANLERNEEGAKAKDWMSTLDELEGFLNPGM
ncbi:MAG: hypothetical protein Q9182_004623 [Xanthomendoza sp. 2 TL-2023]